MRGLGFALIGLAVALAIGMFGCWLGTVWTGDPRWGETGLALFIAVLASGMGGGITVTFAPKKVG